MESKSGLSVEERSAAVARVRREVARACDRDGVLRQGERIVLACSGGADSTAMLDVCLRLAPPREWQLTVVNIDHGLRPDSASDADSVKRMCADSGISFVQRAVELAPGSGVQARAREARYAALRSVAGDVGADVIATAHTADDQAETVLMRALSQATPVSLGGIPARSGDLARPLLGLWREQTRAYCDQLGLAYFDDPANEDLEYTRSRIRHELMPAIEAVFPAAKRRLVALGRHQRELRQYDDHS